MNTIRVGGKATITAGVFKYLKNECIKCIKLYIRFYSVINTISVGDILSAKTHNVFEYPYLKILKSFLSKLQ